MFFTSDVEFIKETTNLLEILGMNLTPYIKFTKIAYKLSGAQMKQHIIMNMIQGSLIHFISKVITFVYVEIFVFYGALQSTSSLGSINSCLDRAESDQLNNYSKSLSFGKH